MNRSHPIKVLHLIDGLAGGGSERLLWDIVRLSDPERFEHRIITIQPDSGDFVYADRLRAQGAYYQPASSRVFGFLRKHIQDLAVQERLVPVRKFLTLTWRLGGYGLSSRETLKALIGFRPDVMHTHGYYAFVAGLATKAISRKPLMHTVPATFSQMKDARYGWTPRLYARAHRWVDRFFTGKSINELTSVSVPAAKVSLISDGVVDLDAIGAVRKERERYYAEIRRSLGLSGDAHIALSVGRLHPSKGHLFALESLHLLLDRFPNLHWVALGEGLQRQELEVRARELKVAEHVHLIGFHADPLPYYAAADIYLRTPVIEAENLSSYQASAMGLPIVGFDTGCGTELIGIIGNGLLVPNRDSAALSQAVVRILTLPDGGRTIGELGAEYSRDHFDIREVTSRFFSVYAELSNGVAVSRRALK